MTPVYMHYCYTTVHVQKKLYHDNIVCEFNNQKPDICPVWAVHLTKESFTYTAHSHHHICPNILYTYTNNSLY